VFVQELIVWNPEQRALPRSWTHLSSFDIVLAMAVCAVTNTWSSPGNVEVLRNSVTRVYITKK